MAERELTPEEEAVTRIQATEQDIDRMSVLSGPQTAGEPGDTDDRMDVDRDDDQMHASTSHPLLGRD